MSEEQEPFETMMRKMCDSVLRDMKPQVVQAEQARAELRDRFAMAALTGLLADHTMNIAVTEFADLSYEYADAMLKARGDD
jgi:hypothetical protein